MKRCASAFAALVLALAATATCAAPDEDRLGRAQGYPVGTPENWFFDESVRIGSFSNLDQVRFRTTSLAPLRAASAPMPLPRAAAAERFARDLRWREAARDGGRSLTIDDYLARQRVMALLVIKDGEVLVERYQYERTPAHRFVSHSMAKTIAALAFAFALQEGRITSLDVRADRLAPELAGTLYGEATVRQLLRMSSGVRFSEQYDGRDDLARFTAEAARRGIDAAARLMTEREAAPGERFRYASAETSILSLVAQRATGEDLATYLTPRLWQAIGAEHDALWLKNTTGVISAGGGFNATLRDYGRLAAVLANDGKRPDTGAQVLPRDYLVEATGRAHHPAAFQPGRATPYFGYGYQVWLYPGEKRRFALLGVYGQMIAVDPAQRLAMVQLAANETARAGSTTLARDADALWRGIVGHFGRWD